MEQSILSKDTQIAKYEEEIANLKYQLENYKNDNHYLNDTEETIDSINTIEMEKENSFNENLLNDKMDVNTDYFNNNTKIFMKESKNTGGILENIKLFLKLSAGMSFVSINNVMKGIKNQNKFKSAYIDKSFEEFCIKIKNTNSEINKQSIKII